jgi:hypothetical protein
MENLRHVQNINGHVIIQDIYSVSEDKVFTIEFKYMLEGDRSRGEWVIADLLRVYHSDVKYQKYNLEWRLHKEKPVIIVWVSGRNELPHDNSHKEDGTCQAPDEDSPKT